MRKMQNVSYSDPDRAAAAKGFKLDDTVPGSLVDNVLYVLPGTENTYPAYMAGYETYENMWSSVLTVYIARTPRDIERLLARWNSISIAYQREQAS